MIIEEIVKLKNTKGQTLYGILHSPGEVYGLSGRIGINLLNPGLKNRVAPNRLNIKIARKLAAQGYYVLRMDPAGIGDSEGEITEYLAVDIWGEIQQGMFVQDIISMNDFLINTCKLDGLILMGSCGGAISAILCAEQDFLVKNLVLIDVPVTLTSTKTISEKYLNIIEADEAYQAWLTSSYLKSILNPKKWWRFLTMKSDYKAIVKIVALKLRRMTKRQDQKISEHGQFRVSNMNPHFIRAFKQVMSRKIKVLFLRAEKDGDTKLFYKGFSNVSLKSGNPYEVEGLYTICEIEDANHIYTLTKSQDQLIDRISDWLAALYHKKIGV